MDGLLCSLHPQVNQNLPVFWLDCRFEFTTSKLRNLLPLHMRSVAIETFKELLKSF